MNGLIDTVLQMMDTTPNKADYTGEDGLLYCVSTPSLIAIKRTFFCGKIISVYIPT